MRTTALFAAGGVLAAGLSLCMLANQPAYASSMDALTQDQIARQADLVFQGQVIAVDYRMSKTGPGLASIPHTFVTYRIDHLLKGRSQNGVLITLRMQGGPVPGSDRAMLIAGAPNFDIGDNDLLFVSNNGNALIPLVGWSQGRYRIINDKAYSDDGREVFLDKDNRVVLGAVQPLPDVRNYQMGNVSLTFPTSLDGTANAAPTGARRATGNDLRNAVGRLIQQQTPAGSGAAMVIESSTSPAMPFAVAAPRPAAAPRVAAATPASSQGVADPMEQRLAEDALRRASQPIVMKPKQP